MHGRKAASYYGSDNALVADFSNSRIFVTKVSTASLVLTIDTAAAGYNGTGTIAVAPNLTTALAMGTTNSLKVIQAPFGPGSAITSITLPGVINSYQGQAIVFNNAGRAFVYNTAGISVLDSPYTAIAFTIPVSNGASGSIGITPDGNQLLVTDLNTNQVKIFGAPFSAASTSTSLTIPGGDDLDGIMVAPDGGSAIVVSSLLHHAAAITAPFSSTSTVETFTLPAGTVGFEDVGISADSKIAILTGDSSSEPAVFINAPFTAAGATITNVPIAGVANSSRGNGSVRFQPPGLAPGLTISKSAPATVNSGSNLTYTITYDNTGSLNAANVVIKDPLPAGTTFVNASNGGALVAGNVVFNIGAVAAGAGPQTVTFTVLVHAAPGGTVNNAGYTIEADTVAPIAGPPVATSVNASPQADLAITKTDGVTTAIPGGSVTYTITASNPGPGNAVGATVADTFPASLTVTGWSCVGAGGGTCTASGSGNINDTVNLPAGGSVTYTATATISASATGTLSNTATVSVPAGVTDPTPGNNSATDTDTLAPSTDLSITKTDGSAGYTPLYGVSYTIVVGNNGPSNATGVTVSDPVPASIMGVTVNCVASGTASCGTNATVGNNVSFTGVNIAAGAANFITITVSGTVSASATGDLTNSAVVTPGAGATDPNPANNASADIDVPLPRATLGDLQTAAPVIRSRSARAFRSHRRALLER